MFSCNFISIVDNSLYRGDIILNNVLSRCLFNVYLMDFDTFVCQNILSLSSDKLIHLPNIFYTLETFFPIKSHKFFYSKHCGKEIWINKFLFTYMRYKTILNSSSYSRKLYFLRFLDYFILASSTLKSVCFALNKRVNNFIRTHLRFDLRFSDVSSVKDKFLFFAGYNIVLQVPKKNAFVLNLSFNNKYVKKVLYRLELYKSKFSKKSIRRFNFELLDYINKSFDSSYNYSFNFNYHKIWFFLFQLECIRTMQLLKIILKDDQVDLFAYEYSFPEKWFYISKYYRYSFDIYILRFRSIVKKVMVNSINLEGSSLNPLDLTLKNFFHEYKKRFVLFFNECFLRSSHAEYLFLSSLDSSSISSFSTGLSLSNRDLNYFKSVYKSKSYSKFYLSKSSLYYCLFDVVAPISLCFEKLRLWGLFHKTKFKPKGNPIFLSLDDLFIIKSFGCIAYSFLDWFRCCKNLSSVKILVGVIKDSCFLTLSRKHNKSKSWVYTIYNSDLIVLETFTSQHNFFPSFVLLSRLKRKFFFSRKNFLFLNERIFLT